MAEPGYSPFPVLKTPTLVLRQLADSDRQEIFALRSNPAVNQYLGRKPAQSTDDAMAFIQAIHESIRLKQALYWAITFIGDDKLIGCIGLFNFSADKQRAEIGFEILPEYQGRGIMQEAAAAIQQYAMQTIGLQSIEAGTHPGNLASVALLRKLGFTDTGKTDGICRMFCWEPGRKG